MFGRSLGLFLDRDDAISFGPVGLSAFGITFYNGSQGVPYYNRLRSLEPASFKTRERFKWSSRHFLYFAAELKFQHDHIERHAEVRCRRPYDYK
jgi:hypothetical protein